MSGIPLKKSERVLPFGRLGRLTGVLILFPGMALAEVCDKERPGWDGVPATALSEAFAMFSTVPALALLVASIVAIRLRVSWVGLVVVLLWAGLISFVALAPPTDIQRAALVEGCVGSPWLFIVIVIGICAVIVLRTMPNTKET